MEQEQIGGGRDVPAGDDHGERSGQPEVEEARSRRRRRPASARSGRPRCRCRRPSVPRRAARSAAEYAASAARKAGESDDQRSPAEPFRGAGEDHLDRCAGQREDERRARRRARGSWRRSAACGPARAPRSTGWPWSGRGRRPGIRRSVRLYATRKEPVAAVPSSRATTATIANPRPSTVTLPPNVRKTSVRSRAGAGGT